MLNVWVFMLSHALLLRIEELQTLLNEAHRAPIRQEGLSGIAASGERFDDMQHSTAEQHLRAQLALLQHQLRASQVLLPLASCALVI